MPEATRHDRLVDALALHLTAVRPLPSPWLRAVAWSAGVIALGAALSLGADLGALRLRMGVADLWLSLAGSALTMVTAAAAAFQTSVPGRSARWAALPLLPVALWLGASGFGCLRGFAAPGTDMPDAREMTGCLAFILGFSLPLSLALFWMLRRACPLRPNLTAALGGLAAAAGAATLLVPFHPHDATASDLAVHVVVAALVIGLNGLLGGRLLDGSSRRGPPA
ncbi:hypothetical protein OPKNFCMD_0751 [Methylobacterium crusticola]|uniref:DUF1109 domain-containing protein n=1 Tax=Methylobacterium crusticola TaxID=1697972 RepID=A0ABQ4QTN7_9HYPH|nr:NrsF family protein [Methylobacterium crusticola]GJD48036.1 hypothetical protein OPKNFCMD_0751 [Methylobacterium crusticola]